MFLKKSKLNKFWVETVAYVAYVWNKCFTKSN